MKFIHRASYRGGLFSRQQTLRIVAVLLSVAFVVLVWQLTVTSLTLVYRRNQILDDDETIQYRQPLTNRDDQLLNLDIMLQLMLPDSMTYTKECQTHILYNRTWGKQYSPWADKAGVKTLIEDLRIPNLKIPRTLMLLNYTVMNRLDLRGLRKLLLDLPEDFVIKPTHTSGAVARVLSKSRYSCFKKCKYPTYNTSLKLSIEIMLKNMKYSVSHMHSNVRYEAATKGRQMQYNYVPRQIIIEEYLDMNVFKEWHWWVVNGRVVFICLRCGERGSYYSTRFQPLTMSQGLEPCKEPPTGPPKSWSTMLNIASRISQHIQGVVRIDLYANDDDIVYFSEVTLTSTSCSVGFVPVVADALLFAILKKNISVSQVTPELVERLINDRSCIEVDANASHWSKFGSQARNHASPTDLCLVLDTSSQERCISSIHHLASYPLQCVAVDAATQLPVQAVGQFRETTWRHVVARVDWPLACCLIILLMFLNAFKFGTKEGCQLLNVFLYLLAVVIYKWQSPYNNDGFFSPQSLMTTVAQSYQVFALVHPVESRLIVFTHITTYWFEIAAWRAKTLQGMLLWYLLYEFVASFVNEYCHHQEDRDDIRCMRLLFIQRMKQYAVDDVIRAYLCAPFLTYGYLLPKFVMGLIFQSHSGAALFVLSASIVLWWRVHWRSSNPAKVHLEQRSQ